MAIAVNKDPQKETLTPTPNGVITDFSTSGAYKTGSISIWQNGLLKDKNLDDGFTELTNTTVRMKIPPLTGDTIQAQFDPE